MIWLFRETQRKSPKCPVEALHTTCPKDYLEWHKWAARMGKTHKQVKCKGCGLYAIWTPKEEAK